MGLDVAYDGGRRRGMEVGGIGMLSSGDTFFDLEMVFVFLTDFGAQTTCTESNIE